METIKERLNKCLNDHILKSVTGKSTVVHTSDIEAFIAQELTLLAEEIDTRIIDSNFSPHIKIGFGKGTSEAADIVRAHVKELTD